MSTEQNKTVIRRLLEEVLNQGNMAALDELIHPDFVEREALPAGIPSTREGVDQFFALIRSGFPDMRVAIDDVVAEGDEVVVRSTWSGTHKGEFAGVPPTGKHVSFGVIDIVRIADGKIAEHWGQIDNLGLMQQLGAIPAPPG